MKESNTLNLCVCINVSRPQKFKIPPQIRSVPTIMDTNGQVLTGQFVRQFVSTVLPKKKNSDPLKRPPQSTPSSSGAAPGKHPSISSIPEQQRANQQGGGLQSANFGTEFGGFSYLPGGNDLNESFYDFEYLDGSGPMGGMGKGPGHVQGRQSQQSSQMGGSKKGDELQRRLEEMKASRSRDMGGR